MIEIHEASGGMNLDRANKLLAGLGDGKQLRNAIYNALNRAGIKGRNEAGSFASKAYQITKGGFDKHTKVKYHIHYGGGKLSGGAVSCEISFAGSVIPLIEFQTRFSKDGGVYSSVKKGSGGKIDHAFIANAGRYGVFERIGKSRFPIEQLFGPSTAHFMQEETVVKNMDKAITTAFNERLDHEIDRILNGWT